MESVRLSGLLVCRDAEEAASVAEHLPRHVALTREEPGCVSFDVVPTDDPLVWRVEETFAGRDAFAAHQHRASGGDWGRATAGIERQYTVTGL